MWDESQIASAAKSIAEQASTTTRLDMRGPVVKGDNASAAPTVSPSKSTSNYSTPSVIVTPITKGLPRVSAINSLMDEAWSILTSEGVASDSSSFANYLKEIGLIRLDFLKYCDDSDAQNIAKHLRIVPRKGFLVLMNRIKEASKIEG